MNCDQETTTIMETENENTIQPATNNITITPSTPANKLTRLTSDINNILQELQNHSPNLGSPSRQQSTPAYKERISVTRYFEQQRKEIQKIITNAAAATTLPTNQSLFMQNHRATKSLPEYYNNAKYEDIICCLIKPLYDGSPEQLVPFLNQLDIWHQDKGWYPITFLKILEYNYDLIRHFTKLNESIMLTEAKLRWKSPTVDQDKHTVEHPTYKAQVLARILL